MALRKITDKAKILSITKYLKSLLPNEAQDRQWHLHKALNCLTNVRPVLRTDMWSNHSTTPTFCFLTEKFDDSVDIHMFYVDTKKFDLPTVESVLVAWIREEVKTSQVVHLDSFPNYLYMKDMFSKHFNLLHVGHHPTLWLSALKDVPLTLPEDVTLGSLDRTDVADTVAQWKYNRGVNSVQLFEQLIAAGVPSTCVRTKEGRLIGYTHFNNQGTLGNLKVDEERRNQNLGSVLIYHLCEKLLKINCRPLIEVDSGNQPAIAVFTKIGFDFASESVYLVMEQKNETC